MAQRKVNGEGTIYKRKDGRYEAALYVLTTIGTRKRVRVYGKTWDEAHKKLVAAKANEQQGIPMPDHSWKLAHYLDHWLEYGVRQKRRPLTYKRHESVVRLYLKPGLGRYTLGQLSVSMAQQFIDRLTIEGRDPATTFQVRKSLSAALTYAMRQELVVRNVARLVEIPSYNPDEAEHWTPEEALHFLQVARQDPLYPAFALLILYGLRSGEVLGLRWCDVDCERAVVRIRQQVQRIEGKLRQVPLKTRTSERDEPLLATARDIFDKVRVKQAADRTVADADWMGIGTDQELVFTTRSGAPVEAHNMSRSFLRICKQNGLRRITLHGLRHTNATTQKELHVHERDIQAVLGHGDAKTTRIYEHTSMDSKRNALRKVEDKLFGELTSVDNRDSSRQILPQAENIVALTTSFIYGGASQTRTGDTRLFRASDNTLPASLTEVKTRAAMRLRLSLLGAVAVIIAVSAEVCPLSEDGSSCTKVTQRLSRIVLEEAGLLCVEH